MSDPAPYPSRGSSPWEDTLKGYIDTHASDSAVAANILNQGSETYTALTSTIAGQVEAEVPPLVAQAIADDDTVAQAAADAVADAI